MTDVKPIYLDLRKDPELYQRIVELAERNVSTAPRIAKKLIADGLAMQEKKDEYTKIVKKVTHTVK